MPLPIERVKVGDLGRRVVRAVRRGVERERQQPGNWVGDVVNLFESSEGSMLW